MRHDKNDQDRIDDFQVEALRMLERLDVMRRSVYGVIHDKHIKAVADAAEAFADAVTHFEEAYEGRKHELSLARAALERSR